jgi:hypothetical protein
LGILRLLATGLSRVRRYARSLSWTPGELSSRSLWGALCEVTCSLATTAMMIAIPVADGSRQSLSYFPFLLPYLLTLSQDWLTTFCVQHL